SYISEELLMENAEYPVFHTRWAMTMSRRRLWAADGSPAGWLIVDAADRSSEAATKRREPLAEYDGELDTALSELAELDSATSELAVHDGSRPPIPAQQRRTPGACCPVPGCSHRHDGDEPPQLAYPSPH
ncbi:MAG: hypothetical protein ACRD0P_11955, partial [Stackebrandtia sp.]